MFVFWLVLYRRNYCWYNKACGNLWIKYRTLTSSTTNASHYSSNCWINEEKRVGKDGVDRSNYRLFSNLCTSFKLHSSRILDKKLWLELVFLVWSEYEEPDYAIICQTIYMQQQFQAFLITNDPLLTVSPQKNHCHPG